MNFATGMVAGSLPLALLSEGNRVFIVALVMSMGVTTAACVSIPMGWVADAIGKRRTLTLALGCAVCALTGQFLAHGAVESALAWSLQAFANVSFNTAQLAFILKVAREERRVSSTSSTAVVVNVGLATAPVFAVFLWQHGIGRHLYLLGVALAIINILLVSILPADTITRHRHPRTILLRSAWLPAIMFGVAANLQSGVIAALSVAVYHHRGIANPALLLAVTATTALIARYPMARLVETFGSKALAIPTVIMQASGCLVAGFAWDSTHVILGGILLGWAWAGMYPSLLSMFLERSSNATRGRAMGALAFAGSVGGALGGLIATISSAIGLGYTFALICAALSSVSVLPIVLMSRGRARKSSDDKGPQGLAQAIPQQSVRW